jgi:hypothetical protein
MELIALPLFVDNIIRAGGNITGRIIPERPKNPDQWIVLIGSQKRQRLLNDMPKSFFNRQVLQARKRPEYFI